MIQYEVQLNQGNEALQTGKTITANEVLLTCDEKALAREIHHQNSLIPEDVAASVLGYFGKAAAQLMAMGFAIQFKNTSARPLHSSWQWASPSSSRTGRTC